MHGFPTWLGLFIVYWPVFLVLACVLAGVVIFGLYKLVSRIKNER